MLGRADAVGIGDLRDRDPTLDRRCQINLVRAYPAVTASFSPGAFAILSAVR